MKNISIHQLIEEWDKSYTIHKEIPTNQLIDITKNENNLLDVRISHTAKIFGIHGNGTHTLRKMRDIAMAAQKQSSNTYLPNNNTTKGNKKPLWNVKHGYMYYKNEENTKILNRLILTINHINKTFKGYQLSVETPTDATNKTEGIIGVDIVFHEPKWLSKIITGDALFNPIIDKNGRAVFSKGATTHKTINAAIQYLHKKTNRFNSLYPKQINITKRSTDPLHDFIGSECAVSILSYNHHSRILYKEGTHLCIMDPWKQTADSGTKRLMDIYSNLKFIKRTAEQGSEGSCATISLARAIYTSDQGIETVMKEIPHEYLVLAQRLVSRFRRAH